MKSPLHNSLIVLALLALSTVNSEISTALAQGTAFTYQGQLVANGAPTDGSYDLQFILYNASVGGSQAGPILTNSATAVSNGLFTVTLDFGEGTFTGTNYWLDIAVRTNGVGTFAELSPRQPLTPAPYAVFAAGTAAAGLSGSLSLAQLPSAVITNNETKVNLTGNLSGTFSGNGNGLTNLNASRLASGVVPTNVLSGFQPPNYNTVSGGFSNSAAGFGAFIGGGGFDGTNYDGNSAQAASSTISGGLGNLIPSTGPYAFIGGGASNAAGGYCDFVGGGLQNTASGAFTTVGGGLQNAASGQWATVGGGIGNTASYYYATVPGGFGNTASGINSFAAGNEAQAIYDGSFVWADFQFTPFASTAANQFAVRASGGVLLAADVQLDTSTYHNLSLSGGNSIGYLYGSYHSILGDGIHLGYNYYYDAAGAGHVINTGGGTSRITAEYGEIVLAVGGVNVSPNAVRVDATTSGVTVYGTFNNSSDRNAKQSFSPVSASQILEKVAQLPISEWSYKEDAATRHIGPMGQDFYSIFNLGTDEKHIAPIDEGGVALAAIQGLNQKLQKELEGVRAENAELKQRLEVLEKIVLSQKSY